MSSDNEHSESQMLSQLMDELREDDFSGGDDDDLSLDAYDGVSSSSDVDSTDGEYANLNRDETTHARPNTPSSTVLNHRNTKNQGNENEEEEILRRILEDEPISSEYYLNTKTLETEDNGDSNNHHYDNPSDVDNEEDDFDDYDEEEVEAFLQSIAEGDDHQNQNQNHHQDRSDTHIPSPSSSSYYIPQQPHHHPSHPQQQHPQQHQHQHQHQQRPASIVERQHVMESELFGSAEKQRRIGLPRALAVHRGRTVAVGTSYGLVIMLGTGHSRPAILGGVSDGSSTQRGGVQSMAFSQDGEWLAVGHEHGTVVMWDIRSRSPLKEMREVCGGAAPVVYLRFLRHRNRFIAGAASGTVCLCHLSKMLFRYTVDTVPVATTAEAVTAAVGTTGDGRYEDLLLVAEACRTEMRIRSSHVSWDVVYRLPLSYHDHNENNNNDDNDENNDNNNNNNNTYIPVLAYLPAHRGSGHPMLAVGYGHHVTVLQIYEEGPGGALDFFVVSDMDVGHLIRHIGFIGKQVLCIYDGTDVHIVDPMVRTVVESAAISRIRPVTAAVSQGRLYVLGQLSTVAVGVKRWEQRIDQLVHYGVWEEALQLALAFYQGNAAALVGMSLDARQQREEARQRVGTLLLAYLDAVLRDDGVSGNSGGNGNGGGVMAAEMEDGVAYGLSKEGSGTPSMEGLVRMCVEYSVAIGDLDGLLFTEVFPRFARTHRETVFMGTLQTYLRDGVIRSVPPRILNRIIAYHVRRESLDTLEECILQLDLSRIYFDDLVRECQHYRLYRVLAYAYAVVRQDDRGLMEELVRIPDARGVLLTVLEEWVGITTHPRGVRRVPVTIPGDGSASQRRQQRRTMREILMFLMYSADDGKGALSSHITNTNTNTHTNNNNNNNNNTNNNTNTNTTASTTTTSTTTHPRNRYVNLVTLLRHDTRRVLGLLEVLFNVDADHVTGTMERHGDEGAEEAGRISRAMPNDALADILAAEMMSTWGTDDGTGEKGGEDGTMDKGLPHHYRRQGEEGSHDLNTSKNKKDKYKNKNKNKNNTDNSIDPSDIPLVWDAERNLDGSSSVIITRSNVMSILLSIATAPGLPAHSSPSSSPSSSSSFTPKHRHHRHHHHHHHQWPQSHHLSALYAFLAQFVSRGLLDASAELIHRMFMHLAYEDSPPGPEERVRREEYLLGMLRRYGRRRRRYNADRLISIAEKAEFYRICVYLHLKEGNYTRVLDAYLQDPVLKHQVFGFVERVMTDAAVPEEVHTKVKKATMNHLSSLIHINSSATARLIIQCFSNEHDSVLAKLEPYKELQFQYLRSIVDGGEGGDHTAPSSSASFSSSSVVSPNDMRELLRRAGIEVTEQLQNKYIGLLCQYDPHAVYPYLVRHEDYSLDQCLAYCQEHGITDATAYLLERTGDVGGALGLLLEDLGRRVRRLKKALAEEGTSQGNGKGNDDDDDDNGQGNDDNNSKVVREGYNDDSDPYPYSYSYPSQNSYPNTLSLPSSSSSSSSLRIHGRYLSIHVKQRYDDVKGMVDVAIGLCRRNTEQLDVSESEAKDLWFSLLDFFATEQRRLHAALHHIRLTATTRVALRNEEDRISEERMEAQDRQREIERQLTGSEGGAEDGGVAAAELKGELMKIQERQRELKEDLERIQERVEAAEEEERREMNDRYSARNAPTWMNRILEEMHRGWIRRVLLDMMGSVPLPAILDKIVTDHGDDSFGEFKDTITAMLDNYAFECLLRSTTLHMLHGDTFHLGRIYFHKLARALRPQQYRCLVCRRMLAESAGGEDDMVVVFNCGHGFHSVCLGDASVCSVCHSRKQKRRRGRPGVSSSSLSSPSASLSSESSPHTNIPDTASTNDSNSSAERKNKGTVSSRALRKTLKQLDYLNRRLQNNTSNTELLLKLEQTENDEDALFMKFKTSLELAPPLMDGGTTNEPRTGILDEEAKAVGSIEGEFEDLFYE